MCVALVSKIVTTMQIMHGTGLERDRIGNFKQVDSLVVGACIKTVDDCVCKALALWILADTNFAICCFYPCGTLKVCYLTSVVSGTTTVTMMHLIAALLGAMKGERRSWAPSPSTGNNIKVQLCRLIVTHFSAERVPGSTICDSNGIVLTSAF